MNDNPSTLTLEQQIAEIHAFVVRPVSDKLHKAARAVVDARYYHGDDGWDRLKNAIGELEEIVGRTPPHP